MARAGVERLEGGSDILRLPDLQRGDFDALRAGRGLDVPNLKRRIGKARVSHDGQPAQPGRRELGHASSAVSY
jgi:hypothetical protein